MSPWMPRVERASTVAPIVTHRTPTCHFNTPLCCVKKRLRYARNGSNFSASNAHPARNFTPDRQATSRMVDHAMLNVPMDPRGASTVAPRVTVLRMCNALWSRR